MLIDSQFDGVHRRGVAFDLDGGFRKRFRQDGISRDAIVILLSPTGFRDKRRWHFCHHQNDDKEHQYNG